MKWNFLPKLQKSYNIRDYRIVTRFAWVPKYIPNSNKKNMVREIL